jgi:diacylglycerol kinase family enzyme
MSRVLLVVNTNATRHSPRRQRMVQNILSRDHKLEVAVTSHKGHATELASEAVRQGFEVVATLGGDGTANEALNGIVESETALAPLPGGHTNVLARTLGIPRSLEKAATQIARSISRNRRRRIGLGQVDDRYFAFVAGFGFDAEVVEAVERRVLLKKLYRDWYYVSQAVWVYFSRWDRKTPHLMVATDTASASGLYFALVLNSQVYTYFKTLPIRPAPYASFERGLWVVAPKTSKVRKILRLLLSAMLSEAGVRSSEDVAILEDLERVRIVGDCPLALQVDGEFVGRRKAAEIRYVPSAIDVVA